MWVHRPSFFLFKTDTPGGKKYGFLQVLLSDGPMDKSLTPLHGRCGAAAFL